MLKRGKGNQQYCLYFDPSKGWGIFWKRNKTTITKRGVKEAFLIIVIPRDTHAGFIPKYASQKERKILSIFPGRCIFKSFSVVVVVVEKLLLELVMVWHQKGDVTACPIAWQRSLAAQLKPKTTATCEAELAGCQMMVVIWEHVKLRHSLTGFTILVMFLPSVT